MDREFLSIIYGHLSNLNFTVLPKMVKQKQVSITSHSSATDILWNRFLQSFGNLSNCEHSYYKFTYLSLKINNLQDQYIQIINDLRIIGNINKQQQNTPTGSQNYNSNNITSPTSPLNNNNINNNNNNNSNTPVKTSSGFSFFKSSSTPNSTPQKQSNQIQQQQIDENPENSFFFTLAQQTCFILQVRVDMIGIYSALLHSLISQDLDIHNIENSLEIIPTIYKDKITHPLLIQIKTNINYEISILKNLLKSQSLVSKHNFKDSMLLLFKCRIELDSWRDTESSHKSSSSSSSSSSLSSSNERWNSNHIHQWLSMFLNSILAKTSLYFYFPLLNVEEEIGGTYNSFKDIYIKNSPDYISIIENFCLKNNVFFFSLIFECKDNKYSKIGYSFIETEQPHGLGAFPLLYYFPSTDKSSPMQHLPNIIGLIMQNYSSLERPNDILYYLDSRKVKDPQRAVVYDDYLTYFISRVEPGVLVSIIFKEAKKQKDQNINEFLKLFINSLRMSDIFSILKQKDSNK